MFTRAVLLNSNAQVERGLVINFSPEKRYTRFFHDGQSMREWWKNLNGEINNEKDTDRGKDRGMKQHSKFKTKCLCVSLKFRINFTAGNR